jgi:hypothetical protein
VFVYMPGADSKKVNFEHKGRVARGTKLRTTEHILATYQHAARNNHITEVRSNIKFSTSSSTE